MSIENVLTPELLATIESEVGTSLPKPLSLSLAKGEIHYFVHYELDSDTPFDVKKSVLDRIAKKLESAIGDCYKVEKPYLYCTAYSIRIVQK